MSISINYKNKQISKNIINNVFFINEEKNISSLRKFLTKAQFLFVSDLIKSKNLKQKIISFELNSKKKIILISIKKNTTTVEIENLGAEFYNFLKDFKKKDFQINTDTAPIKENNLVGYFIHGFKLKSLV